MAATPHPLSQGPATWSTQRRAASVSLGASPHTPHRRICRAQPGDLVAEREGRPWDRKRPWREPCSTGAQYGRRPGCQFIGPEDGQLGVWASSMPSRPRARKAVMARARCCAGPIRRASFRHEGQQGRFTFGFVGDLFSSVRAEQDRPAARARKESRVCAQALRVCWWWRWVAGRRGETAVQFQPQPAARGGGRGAVS